MFCNRKFVGASLVLMALLQPAAAQTAEGPRSPRDFPMPAWPLASEVPHQNLSAASPSAASVYAAGGGPRDAASIEAELAPAALPASAAPHQLESPVVLASYPPTSSATAPPPVTATAPSTTSDSTSTSRRLGPRGADRAIDIRRAGEASTSDLLSRFGLKFESMYSTATALLFVLGLFFLCMWTLRRGGKKKITPLPTSVVSVLGRVTLAPKQLAELLRVGNKLVLVALTPDGAKPITEVTDPAEVDRLTGLCQQQDPHSASRAFEQVFRELSTDRAPDGFLGQETPVISVLPTSASYRSRGGLGRA
jgi:flagellar biogenesis protein FliO